MNIFARVSGFSRIPLGKKTSVPLLLWALLFESCPQKLLAYQDAQLPKRTAQASKPEAKWQVGTVTAVQPYKVPNADPSVTSYKVSVRVGNTVYVVLNTPRPGSDIGIYARGRQIPVLVGDHTITYNDRLGNSFQLPILSHTTVPPQDSR
jgi:hypothetical protein